MRTIFHITTRNEWEQAKQSGQLKADSLASEGFIHFSRPHQVTGVLARHFRGRDNLVLLQIAQERMKGELKYESAAGDKYPHLYAPLNIESVIEAHEFARGPEGYAMPASLKMVGDTLIRAGQPGDESEIASVHTHAWQQSYRGLVPDEILDTRPLTFRNRLQWWKSMVEGRLPRTTVFVAESAEHGIVGFCSAEPARDQEFEGYGEIGAIYLLNEYKGQGVGATLFAAGKTWLNANGFKSIYLWVLKDNPTIAFYKRMGGELLDRQKTVEIGRPLTELAFAWR